MLIGMRLSAIEVSRVTLTMDAAEYLYNSTGTVHGGVLATLLDSSMGSDRMDVNRADLSRATPLPQGGPHRMHTTNSTPAAVSRSAAACRSGMGRTTPKWRTGTPWPSIALANTAPVSRGAR